MDGTPGRDRVDRRRSGTGAACVFVTHDLTEAIALYERVGFRRCAPYNDYPARLMPYMVFMELELPLIGAGRAR